MCEEFHNYYTEIANDLQEGADKLLKKTLYNPKLFELNKINTYTKEDKIGQGTFGEVFKMRNLKTNKSFALKRVKYETELDGFPITSLREVKILQALNHENIVKLHEVCWNDHNPTTKYRAEFYLSFELCDHDLSGILNCKTFVLENAQKKTIMLHILKGLEYLHKKDIIHRDIKTSNILIDRRGIVKIADFGLARLTKSSHNNRKLRLTGRVVTLWYRAPEILLNLPDYDCAVDMWSAGCVFAELWKREAILPGRTEIQQLNMIVTMIGSFTEGAWPGITKITSSLALPKTEEPPLSSTPGSSLSIRLKRYIDCTESLDLIGQLLTLCPASRADATSALGHQLFRVMPMCADLSQMKLHGQCYEYKMQKQQAEMEHLASQGNNGGGGGPGRHGNHGGAASAVSNKERQYKIFKDHSGVCERKY